MEKIAFDVKQFRILPLICIIVHWLITPNFEAQLSNVVDNCGTSAWYVMVPRRHCYTVQTHCCCCCCCCCCCYLSIISWFLCTVSHIGLEWLWFVNCCRFSGIFFLSFFLFSFLFFRPFFDPRSSTEIRPSRHMVSMSIWYIKKWTVHFVITDTLAISPGWWREWSAAFTKSRNREWRSLNWTRESAGRAS